MGMIKNIVIVIGYIAYVRSHSSYRIVPGHALIQGIGVSKKEYQKKRKKIRDTTRVMRFDTRQFKVLLLLLLLLLSS